MKGHFEQFLPGPNCGILAGTGMLTTAVVSLLQFPLLTASIDGGLEVRDAVNGGCAAAVLACVPYTLWLSRREWRERTAAPKASLPR